MLPCACSTEYFPLTLTLRERIPRILCAHCAPEPTPSPSQEGSNTDWRVPLLEGVRGGLVAARFMGREHQASDCCLADSRWANSGTGVIESRYTILPLPRGEDRGEGEARAAHPTAPSV